MTGAALTQPAMPFGAALRWTALLVLALVGLTAAQQWVNSSGLAGGTADKAQAAPRGWAPQTYADTLQALDREVIRGEARLVANVGSWAAHEALASALHARGQLTGSHEDLAAAFDQAETARGFAPDRGGPVLARAVIALSLHRNAIAAEEVARIPGYAFPAPVGDVAEAEAILGDVALYRGDYPQSLAHYHRSAELQPGLGSSVRLADWHRHHGDFAAARRLLDDAIDAPEATPWARAALLLQRGAIDLQTGDWDGAEALFARADAVFPGWWLARAHLGQMAAVRGDYARAEQLYRTAMEGADRPSVMDALAAVLAAQGQHSTADAMAQRAGELWKARAVSHPAAYADHAFEAFLAEGDTAGAFRLAALNFRTRPYGDSRIGLARASAAQGRDRPARAILEQLDASGWRSAEQYRVLAEVCGRLDDTACASRARRSALAISARTFDSRAKLLFFSNH